MFRKREKTQDPAASDGTIRLQLRHHTGPDPELGSLEGLVFDILAEGSRRSAGYVSLRVGESPELYYLGHIGYRVEEEFRGQGFAGRAVRLLLPLAARRGMGSLVITTDTDNLPSRITCERLGCELERVAPVPERYRDLCMGSRAKCRYVLMIPKEEKGP